MSNILGRVAAAARQARQLKPASAQEFFGLQLAARLDDLPAVRHYAALAQDHLEGHLLLAYQRAVEAAGTVSVARQFHKELSRVVKSRAPAVPKQRLIAVRIERRGVAAAILDGDHLEYAASRTLSSQFQKAVASAESFLARLLSKFSVRRGALEAVDGDSQRSVLQRSVTSLLEQHGLSAFTVSREDLFQAFSQPPARSWKDVRRSAVQIWPPLAQEPGTPFVQDAAALGLYAQIQRLFNEINQPSL